MEAPGQVNEQGQLTARGRGRRRRRGGAVRVRGGGIVGGRGRGARRQHAVPDEIRATLTDHVINHHLTMVEAGRRVQPNVPALQSPQTSKPFTGKTGVYSVNDGIICCIGQDTA